MPDTPASTVRAKRVSALFRLLLTLSAFLFVSGVVNDNYTFPPRCLIVECYH